MYYLTGVRYVNLDIIAAVSKVVSRSVLFFLCWVLAGGVSGAQTVYKSIGPDGKIVYSDTKPAEGKVVKTMKFDNLPGSVVPALAMSNGAQSPGAAVPAGAAATRGNVLYSASWCGYCKKAKAYLAFKGIAYQEVDIDTPDGKSAFAKASTKNAIPLLIAGDRRIQGFSTEAYDAVFANQR